MSHTLNDRGIPLNDIPTGAFKGALFAWVGDPPSHSSRFEYGIYVKTCNSILCPNTGISWSCGQLPGPWHVVRYQKLLLVDDNWWSKLVRAIRT